MIVDNGQTFEVAKMSGCCVGKFAEGDAHRFSTCAAHFLKDVYFCFVCSDACVVLCWMRGEGKGGGAKIVVGVVVRAAAGSGPPFEIVSNV